MKTLIIGAKGMLGHELAEAFAKYNPILWDMDEIDITDKAQIDEKIGKLAPELIINSAAYTNVDACEENEELATKVNAEAVGYLADVAHRLNATLVHYSTDYVFDGEKKEGYVEDDKPGPISAYGRSKLAGEDAILATRSLSETRSLPQNKKAMGSLGATASLRYYIIRSAWLYGAHGKNFVETMLSLAKKGQPIKVIDDQIGSPTYAPDLAQATFDLVESKKPSGIYHRTNDGQISWHGFAKEIFKVFSKDIDLSPCSTDEYPLPAKRPKCSVMKSTKLEPIRSWQEALEDYKSNRHSELVSESSHSKKKILKQVQDDVSNI